MSREHGICLKQRRDFLVEPALLAHCSPLKDPEFESIMEEPTSERRSKYTYKHLSQLLKYSVDTPLRVIAHMFASSLFCCWYSTLYE